MPGMMAVDPNPENWVVDDGPADWVGERVDDPREPLTESLDAQNETLAKIGWLPDLADPATLGCLLALVREAWGDEAGQISGAGFDQRADKSPCYSVWYCGELIGEGDTEAEALVAALEAAP
jgi:hypothetical protein